MKLELQNIISVGLHGSQKNTIQEIIDGLVLNSRIQIEDWRCTVCRQTGAGIKCTKLIRVLSKAVVVYINRLDSWDAYGYPQKNTRNVSVDRFIRIKNEKYHLKTVVEHIGSMSTCGHYICHRKIAKARWAIISDASITYAKSLSKSIEPYLLLYEQI